jgi:hypothetical protein
LAFQGVKQNKNECALLMEQTHKLLDAIIIAHMKSHTCGNLPTNVLNHIGKFTKYVILSELHSHGDTNLGPFTKSIPLLRPSRTAAKSRDSSIRVK